MCVCVCVYIYMYIYIYIHRNATLHRAEWRQQRREGSLLAPSAHHPRHLMSFLIALILGTVRPLSSEHGTYKIVKDRCGP